MPVHQPNSLLEVSGSAPLPHTVGFVNGKHILAATTVISCGEIWDLKVWQTLGIIYLHLPLSQKILHDSQSGWAARWRTRWTWAPAMGHGSLDTAGPCSPPRWHPVWMVVWLSWLALKQKITPLKVLKIKATAKSSFVSRVHSNIQLSRNHSAEQEEQALPSSLWKCQTQLIEGCMGWSPHKIACASTVTSICLCISSGPWRIQHTSFLYLVKRPFVTTSWAYGT